MGIGKIISILCRIKKSEGRNKNGRQSRGSRNYQNRQNETRAKTRDENPPREKSPLPRFAHPRQHFGIHHGVIKRERRFQNREEGDEKERVQPAPNESAYEDNARNNRRKNEDFHINSTILT